MKNTNVGIIAVMAFTVFTAGCSSAPVIQKEAAPVIRVISESSGKFESGGQRIERSMKLSQEARQRIDQKNYVEGLELAQSAIELDPENGDGFVQQGRAFRNLGKAKRAIASFETALKFCDNVMEPLVNISECYRDSRDFIKAKEYIERALERYQYEPLPLCNLAGIYKDLGEFERAKECLAKVLEKYPKDSRANRDMGDLYLFNLNDVVSAVSYYAKSTDNDFHYFYNVSLAYGKIGDTEKANEYINLAKKSFETKK